MDESPSKELTSPDTEEKRDIKESIPSDDNLGKSLNGVQPCG